MYMVKDFLPVILMYMVKDFLPVILMYMVKDFLPVILMYMVKDEAFREPTLTIYCRCLTIHV